MNTKHSPPKFANRLLEWYCRQDMLEDLQGALYEYYYERIDAGHIRKAKWMFVLDVLMHCRPHNIKSKSQNSNIMLRNHIKISIRNIWKNKLSSSLNLIGLSTGLASFILIMLWVNLELSYDRFHEQGEQIYRISNTFKSESESFSQAVSGPALGAQLHKIFADVENATRFYAVSDRLEIDGEFFFESGIGVVDPNFLEMFSFNWIAGDQKTALNDANSIILTQSIAAKYYGDENPIGKSIHMYGTAMKVTGIIADPPETSQIQFKTLLQLKTMADLWGVENIDDRWGGGWFHTYLQLAPETDPVHLQADITKYIGEKLTDWAADGMYYDYFLIPIHDIHLKSKLRYDFGSNGDMQNVIIFISVAFLILLLACINYVNLATAGAIHRSKEVGIRKVIGAASFQLVTQYLVESFLIIVLAISLALGFTFFLLPSFGELTGYTQIDLFTLNHLLYLLTLVFALTFIAGLLPAILISRVNSLKVIKGNLKSGPQYNILRKGLVVIQFAVTVVLLISMFVINGQMSFIQNNDLGMKTQGVLHVNYRGIPEVSEHVAVLKEQLLQLPAVTNVSFLNRAYPVNGLSNSTTWVENGSGDKVMSSIYTMRVDEEFYHTFGLKLVAGRFYSRDFPADTSASIVVNESCIQNFGWGNAENAIGKIFGKEPNERKVIGVIKNFNFEALHMKIEPLRILPMTGDYTTSMALRVDDSNAYELISNIQAVWEKVIPNVPFDVSFMTDDIKNQYTAEYNFRTIFTFFSVISIVIGCLGLFGLATAVSNQRLKEVSIRKVLGASLFEIISLINREFVLLIIVASVLASPIAYYLMNKWLNNFTYHISFEWQFVLFAMLGSVLVTILTISIKAIKTAMTNPAHVLKDE